MEVKKINLFKLVNIFMTVCCLVTAVYNYCGVDILTNCTARSYLNGDFYEYSVRDNLFAVSKNNVLVGVLEADRHFELRNSGFINFTCNASAIAAAGTIAGVAATTAGAGAAVAVGTVGGNAVAAAQITGAIGTIVKVATVSVAAASPAGIFIGAAVLT